MSTYQTELAAMEKEHAEFRRADDSPRGQSGTALDYQLAAELGQFVCKNKGHRMNEPKDFCSRCGEYFLDGEAVSYLEIQNLSE